MKPATTITVINERDMANEVVNDPFQAQVKSKSKEERINPFKRAKSISFSKWFPTSFLPYPLSAHSDQRFVTANDDGMLS